MEWPGSLSREHLARCRQPTRLSTFATVSASHLPPRAVAMPRPLRAAATCLSDFAPTAWASRMAGMTMSA